MTRSRYDDLHDRFDPIATNKPGTRYERLVALVQKALDQTAGVTHDLRLVGKDTQVKHQIDVTITQNNHNRRILIECKDFDVSGDPVGLGVVRNFFGVVDDVKPDEAIVITCNGFTNDAMRYAKFKNIKLAVLRVHRPEDDDGTIKSVEITGVISTPTDYQATIKFTDEAGMDAFRANQSFDRTSDVYLHRPGFARTQFVLALNELFNDASVAKDEALDDGSRRKNITLTGCSIQRGDGAPIPINGIFIGYSLITDIQVLRIHTPIVSLILTPIDKKTDLLIYEKDLKLFRIDPKTGEVLPRDRRDFW